jgi:serine/threonine protein kinase
LKHIGRYEIVRELGRGAMGVVFKARDPLIGRSVAVKTITAGVARNPDLLERFHREAKSAGLLQHPNIVTIYELSESDGSPFIAMEYLEGQSLEQVIASRLPLPLAQRLGYFVQACRAFDYAHSRGVVHRDIKPGNIMITTDGAVKVVDFGIARIMDASKTQTGSLLGTLSYMSPEQLRGQPADERCDIWSLGAVLYECLAYRKPFTGENHGALIRSILDDEPPSPAELVPECPIGLGTVVQRALCKDASARYQTMEKLLLDLEPLWSELQRETVQRLLDAGRKWIAEGQTSEARRLLLQAALIDNKNLAVKALLDDLHASLGVDQTAARVQEIVARGEKLLEEGLFFDARVEVQSALKLDPNHPAARRLQEKVQLQQARVHQDLHSREPGTGPAHVESSKTQLIPSPELPRRDGAPTEFEPSSSLLSGVSSRSWKRAGLYSAGAAVVIATVIVGLGIVAYRQHPRSGQGPSTARAFNPSERSSTPVVVTPLPGLLVPPPAPAAVPAASDGGASIEDRQRHLIDLADAAADTSDYKSAQDRLDEAARLNGPLNGTIGGLRRNFNQQSQSQIAARQEETLWDQAMKHMQAAEFDDAEKLLRELIALPEAGQHRPDAERYVDETIPQRRYEDLLWSDLQQYSRSLSLDHLENEVKTLDKLLILGGSRQQQANRVRQALIAQLAEANAMKNRRPLATVPDWGRDRIASLQDQFDSAVRQGDVEALPQLQNLRPQFKALTGAEGVLDMDARDYLNDLIPKAEKQIQANLAKGDSDSAADREYEAAVKHFDRAVAAQDRGLLRSQALVEFRQIVSFGGVRASEAAQYVNVLIPQALKSPVGDLSESRPPDQ